MCCYLINRIYKKYDQSPVIVSFSTKESPIFTIPFPAVTVCLMSKSVRTKLNYTKVIHMKEDNETVTPEEYVCLFSMLSIKFILGKLFTGNANFGTNVFLMKWIRIR